MDCAEFRRRLLQDPLAGDPALEAHERACPDCAGFARRARADEHRLRAALRVSPPPDLAERVGRALAEEQAGRRPRAALPLGLTAGILLLLGALLVPAPGPVPGQGQALAAAVLEHLQRETEHLEAAGPVAGTRVAALFGRFGARLEAGLGRVNFAAECPMRRGTGVHLVLPGSLGPVTVLFMPGDTPLEVLPVRSGRFQGRVTPTLWGSIAVIGPPGEPLEGLETRVRRAVRWPVDRTAEAVSRGAGAI